jgi:hypothetical protein
MRRTLCPATGRRGPPCSFPALSACGVHNTFLPASPLIYLLAQRGARRQAGGLRYDGGVVSCAPAIGIPAAHLPAAAASAPP